MILIFFFFFFQAEDGIRDLTVTGVQTCALPILTVTRLVAPSPSAAMARASSWQRSASVAAKASYSAPLPSMGGFPANPLASTKTVSLVLMSSSTVSRLKVVAAAADSAPESSGGAIAQ